MGVHESLQYYTELLPPNLLHLMITCSIFTATWKNDSNAYTDFKTVLFYLTSLHYFLFAFLDDALSVSFSNKVVCKLVTSISMTFSEYRVIYSLSKAKS